MLFQWISFVFFDNSNASKNATTKLNILSENISLRPKRKLFAHNKFILANFFVIGRSYFRDQLKQRSKNGCKKEKEKKRKERS
jgi:hypothetical protein